MQKSFIYVIGPENTTVVKIGFSSTPEKRLKSLQTGYPSPLKLYYQREIESTKVRLMEDIVHKSIKHLKTNGEWFNITPEDAKLEIDFIFIRWEDEPNAKTLSKIKLY